LEQIIFEIINISENNIIIVELGKVLGYEPKLAQVSQSYDTNKRLILGQRFVGLRPYCQVGLRCETMIQSPVYPLVHITVDMQKTRANYSRFHVSFVVD
jgi:hypothetical protein